MLILKSWPPNCIYKGATIRTSKKSLMKAYSILIFDQEEAVRDSLHFVLCLEGYQCFSTGSESEALDLLVKESIGIVIMNSDFSGLTALVQKFKEKIPFLKIILISSYAEFEVTQQALTHGADDFVLKPLDFDELIECIKNLPLSPP